MAAGRCRSAATSSGRRPFDFRCLASLPAVVVLPEPWRPTIRMTWGGLDWRSGATSPPSVFTNSSWTILMTCWPGVRLLETSAPSARSLTRARKDLTTATFTSASSRARRTSRRAASTSASDSRPLPRRAEKLPSKRCVSESNIDAPRYRTAPITENPLALRRAEQTFSVLNMRSVVERDDLTAEARIRQAAITRFPTEGIEGTTIRAIAADAGVSPALVLHHFGSKQGLLDACDRYVVDLVRTTKTQAVIDGTATDSGFMASMYRIAPPVVRYLGWSLARGAPAAAGLFDELVAESERLLSAAEERGLVRRTPDPHGRAVVVLTMQLGFVVLREHVTRALGMDAFGMEGLMRITERQMELFGTGLFTPEAARETAQALDQASRLLAQEGPDGR